MGSRHVPILLAAMLCSAGAPASAATEVSPSTESPEGAGQPAGQWETDVRTSVLVNAWGFRPSRIVSSTSSYSVSGSEMDGTQGRFLIRGAVRGRYLHWDFLPYTDVPPSTGHGYHVNTVGLETALYVTIGEIWRLGVYHHSVHNVADGSYGFGVDLNALVVDALIINGPVAASWPSWQHGLRLQTHWYLIDRGSPWVLTRDTRLENGQMGRIRARTGFSYAIADDGQRDECSGYGTVSSGGRIASVTLDCAAVWRVTSGFLGTFGRHLLAGPYVSYARNLTRVRDFGGQDISAGLRLDILVNENRSQGTIFW